jgi:hypothetical protein
MRHATPRADSQNLLPVSQLWRPRIQSWGRLRVPSSHEEHFASERITEYVVDIGRAIDFKETKTADVCPVQPSVEQNTQLGKLLRLVLP